MEVTPHPMQWKLTMKTLEAARSNFKLTEAPTQDVKFTKSSCDTATGHNHRRIEKVGGADMQ